MMFKSLRLTALVHTRQIVKCILLLIHFKKCHIFSLILVVRLEMLFIILSRNFINYVPTLYKYVYIYIHYDYCVFVGYKLTLIKSLR